MVVYGCLWLHGCVMDVCIFVYIYIYICVYLGIWHLPRSGPAGAGAGRWQMCIAWMCNDVCDYIRVCMVSMDMYGCV